MVETLQKAKSRPRGKLRYHHVMDTVERDIQDGKYLPGRQLPPIKELAERMGLNFLTVRKGILGLAEKGLLDVKPGVGTFVTEKAIHSGKKTINIALAIRKFMLEIDQHHPAIGVYLAGAHRRCPAPKYAVHPMFYGIHHFIEDLGETLIDRKIDGVVIPGAGMLDRDYEFLEANKITTAVADVYRSNQPDDGWIISVCNDSEAVLRQAVEHLRGLGHKRIAFLCYAHTPDKGAIYRWFSKLAFDHQLGDPRELMIHVENPDGHPHWEDVEQVFDLKPLATGVIVLDEFLADVLLAGCERRGIKIPDDLSIVALQDLLPYGHRVPLTAIDGAKQNSQLVYHACDILIRLIEGKGVTQRRITLTPELVIKASTGPAANIYRGITP